MEKYTIVSAKIPKEVYGELTLRIPEGERSAFIRNAILESLQKTPRPDKILELENRLDKVESQIAFIKNNLAKLEVLTFEQGKINPHAFCVDNIDHSIIDYLLHYKGATTPTLAENLKTNRWLVLNRLRKIQRASKKQLGKPIVQYHGGEMMGKKKAWWINEELIEGYSEK